MAGWLILLVGGIYIVTAGLLLLKGNIGLALAFTGYAISNVGLWMIT